MSSGPMETSYIYNSKTSQQINIAYAAFCKSISVHEPDYCLNGDKSPGKHTQNRRETVWPN